MNLKGSKTEGNLKAAFAGESQANRRYLYFAQKADVEGFNDVSAVFRSTAEGETGHAHGHLEFLEATGDQHDLVPGMFIPPVTAAIRADASLCALSIASFTAAAQAVRGVRLPCYLYRRECQQLSQRHYISLTIRWSYSGSRMSSS